MGRLNKRFKLINLDLTDQQSIINAVKNVEPDYVLNFAAQSFVGNSWELSSVTSDVNAIGPLNILNAIKNVDEKMSCPSKHSA